MRTSVHSPGHLYGRQEEIGRIDELTAAARAGRGGALVLRGEAGIGKSTLLDHARRTAPGCLVIQASGSEVEAELPGLAVDGLNDTDARAPLATKSHVTLDEHPDRARIPGATA
ncbi:ATP-binding protein [Streptomyces sp. NPDC051217]|uniref:ATP-binding protein n=1 Tax=Streptomyces sp. NPDC051217 TaxID=3365644 RepID=UPI003795E257